MACAMLIVVFKFNQSKKTIIIKFKNLKVIMFKHIWWNYAYTSVYFIYIFIYEIIHIFNQIIQYMVFIEQWHFQYFYNDTVFLVLKRCLLKSRNAIIWALLHNHVYTLGNTPRIMYATFIGVKQIQKQSRIHQTRPGHYICPSLNSHCGVM